MSFLGPVDPVGGFWSPDNTGLTLIGTAAERAALSPTPSEGQGFYETDTDNVLFRLASAWKQVFGEQGTVNTSESTTSTSFTDLATAGPAVTIECGTTAIVFVSANIANNTAGSYAIMGVAVSGASTFVASDDNALASNLASASAMQMGTVILASGLTAGVNTFTAKYRATANTAIFSRRKLAVLAGAP